MHTHARGIRWAGIVFLCLMIGGCSRSSPLEYHITYFPYSFVGGQFEVATEKAEGKPALAIYRQCDRGKVLYVRVQLDRDEISGKTIGYRVHYPRQMNGYVDAAPTACAGAVADKAINSIFGDQELCQLHTTAYALIGVEPSTICVQRWEDPTKPKQDYLASLGNANAAAQAMISDEPPPPLLANTAVMRGNSMPGRFYIGVWSDSTWSWFRYKDKIAVIFDQDLDGAPDVIQYLRVDRSTGAITLLDGWNDF